MKRYAQIVKLRPECEQEYMRIHTEVWPEVLATIHRCNIRNYSIFLCDGLLFGYFEYHGIDFLADMAKMAEDPNTQRWWDITSPMQERLQTSGTKQWAEAKEVFHVD